MEKELKDYLDKLTSDVAEIVETMATKSDLEGMATKKDLAKLDRKLDKRHKELLDYIEVVDKAVIEHRNNTEAHIKPLKKA